MNRIDDPTDKKISSKDPVFSCIKCGECCRGFGGTYVTDEDVLAIAEFINKPAPWVRENCLAPSGTKFVIKQNKEGLCVFFSEKLCGIHPVKPRMCRQWPYLNQVLIDFSNWRAMGASCPGINTQADKETVEKAIRDSMDNNTPPMD